MVLSPSVINRHEQLRLSFPFANVTIAIYVDLISTYHFNLFLVLELFGTGGFVSGCVLLEAPSV
jgi:hypothetical protein